MNKASCVHIDVLFQQKYDFFKHLEVSPLKETVATKQIGETNPIEEFQELEFFFDKINDFYNPLAVLKNKSLKQLNCPLCIDCFNEPIEATNETIMSRLYVCAICLYVGCFKFTQACHISIHSRQQDHNIFIDLENGYMYCALCKDFQYNQMLEDLFKKCLNKTNSLAFGKFQEWEPSQKILKLLKCFADHSKTKHEGEQGSDNNGNTFELFKIRSSSIIGLRGLLNLGNTCFMNCILQTFTHTPTLRDYFLSDKHVCLHNKNPYQNQHRRISQANKDYCLVCELVVLFQEFYSGKRSIHIPFNLLYQVWTAMKHLAGYEQQDAHEFFIAALNSLHKNCIENDQECISLNKLETLKSTNYNNCHCIIDKIFTGGLQSDVICSNCNYVSTKVDPFWDISLDLGNNLNKNQNEEGNESFNLEDCLVRFTLPETLNSFNCSLCKCTNDAKKQLTMKNLPIVCCFHLKRFEHSNKIHKKISTHISFPEILDMSPFMSQKKQSEPATSPEMADAKKKSNDSNKYFLFAVVNHHGTLESGHYTSFIRLTHDQWFDCDDHIIKKASIEDVMKSEGYLLFYHKIWNEFP